MSAARKRLTREERKQQTHQHILQAAEMLFARRGYEGTTIDEIVAEAGYTRGAFYAHFGSKEAIMRELIAAGFDGDVAAISQMPSSSIEACAAAYGNMARSFYENSDNTLWMLEFQLAAVRHPELRQEYAEQYHKMREAVGRLITDTLAEDPQTSHTRTSDAHARYADIFLVMLSGLSLMKLIDPDRVDERLFEDGFRALVRGM